MIVSGDHVCTPSSGKLTHTRHWEAHTHTKLRRSHPNNVLKNTVRPKMLHYRRLYTDRPDPIVFMSLVVNTSGRLYHDFIRLLFLQAHRETSILVREIPEESDQVRQVRFLGVACLASLKGSVGLCSHRPHPFSPLPSYFSLRAPPKRHMICVNL